MTHKRKSPPLLQVYDNKYQTIVPSLYYWGLDEKKYMTFFKKKIHWPDSFFPVFLRMLSESSWIKTKSQRIKTNTKFNIQSCNFCGAQIQNELHIQTCSILSILQHFITHFMYIMTTVPVPFYKSQISVRLTPWLSRVFPVE